MSKYFTLITGATGGLGQAYVWECIGKMSNDEALFLTATNQERLQNFAQQVTAKFPNLEIVCKECDLSDSTSRRQLFDFIAEQGIVVNRLILNAGLIMVEQPFVQNDIAKALKAIQVNCEASVDFAYHFIKNRNKNKRFYLINVSSFAGFNPMPQMAIYGATKSFLINFFVALREELWGEDVYISCVCPSGMATTQEMKDSIKSQGFGGKVTENKVGDIARISLAKNSKNKAIIVVGGFNKFLRFSQAQLTKPTVAKFVNKRWTNIANKGNKEK